MSNELLSILAGRHQSFGRYRPFSAVRPDDTPRLKLGCEAVMRRLDGESWVEVAENMGLWSFHEAMAAARVWRKSLGPVRKYGKTDIPRLNWEDVGCGQIPGNCRSWVEFPYFGSRSVEELAQRA